MVQVMSDQKRTTYRTLAFLFTDAAELKEREAFVTVRVVSQLISAVVKPSGEVVDGDPETVVEVRDVWTFARDTRSRDPNWKLVETESEDE